MTIFAPTGQSPASPGAFKRNPPGEGGREAHHERYADGSGLRNLTRNPGRDGHPVWSSDGRTIGFVSSRGGNRDIYVMNADGSGQRNLTRGLHQPAFGIAWSPLQKQSG